MQNTIIQADWTTIALFGCVFFATIYCVFAGATLLITQLVLSKAGIGQVLDPRPIPAGQIKRELLLSSMSV